MSSDSMLSLEDITVTFSSRSGHKIEAVREVSFQVARSEFVCLLGPSGCGKSTILNLLGGFVRPTKGRLFCNGIPITRPDRDRGVVFQRHNLFPWHTVAGNIGFGPRVSGADPSVRDKIVTRYLEKGDLVPFAGSYPDELSVGMQQRVALLRSFANNPEILLMDEPFASLDTGTAARMRRLLCDILKESRTTVVFVTHDIDEALELADRIIVFTASPGSIKREFRLDKGGAPREMSDPFLVEMRCAIAACYK